MYSQGDLVFYGSTGVCEVIDVGEPDIEGLPDGVEYYKLQPISQERDGVIYVPVNTTVFMRDPVTDNEAKDLINMVSELQPLNPKSRNPKVVSDFYRRMLTSYSCKDLLQLIVSLTVKKRDCQAKNKRLNQTQSSYLKKANDLICNEFSLALGISNEDVQTMIEERILS